MTTAYWCVLAAIILPYIWTLVSKLTGGFKPQDNHNPRDFYNNTTNGVSKRANWAQMNTFESIPGFMAAVIIAHQVGAEQASIDKLAVAYIALRVVYGLLYLADKASIRTLVWAAAQACIVGLFVICV